MWRRIIRNLLLAWVVLSISYGCAAKPSPALVENTSTPPPVTPTPSPTILPSAEPTQPVETPLPRPSPTIVEQEHPAPGWTVFSNPDFVNAVAVQNDQLWAATMGGVAVWDLRSEKPLLYTTRDGLAEIQGNDVVYCPVPEERMLVAHPSGWLSAYSLSLKRWSRIPITLEDGKTLHGIRTLYCDKENKRLLVGSADGLGILDLNTDRWKLFGPDQGLKVNTIRAIGMVGQTIWIAAGDKSAYMISGKTIFPFNSESGFPSGSVNDVFVAPDTSIWFGYSTGLVHYYDKIWNLYGQQTPSGFPFRSVDFVKIGLDKQVWVASAEQGVCPFNPVTLFCSTVYPSTQGAPITDLEVGKDGVAYASTDGAGVLVLDKDHVRHLAFQNGQLLSNHIFDLAAGQDGKIWVSTDRGVNILDLEQPDAPWQEITPQPKGLVSARVTGLFSTPEGIWFFYDQENRVSFFDGKSWLQLDESKGITDPVFSAAIDQRGYTWFATKHGVDVWDGALLRTYAPTVQMAGNSFRVLSMYHDGMLAGTDMGLLRYQRFQWETVLPRVAVRAIAEDRQGGLLLGTERGLVRFDGSQSYLWMINLGTEVLNGPEITSIAWDGKGQLWAGTAHDGLLLYNGQHWIQYDTSSGLPSNHVQKIITDSLGTLWIATDTGDGGGALVRYVP